MKSSTLVILCAALAFSAPSIATAQSTTVDTNVGAEVTVDGNGVGVNAGAEGSATTDGNATTDGDADAAAAGGTALRDALMGNAAVDAAIKARGADDSDVLGATVSGDTITVYIESDVDG